MSYVLHNRKNCRDHGCDGYVGEDEKHQWWNEFNSCLGRSFFRLLPTLSSQRIGEIPSDLESGVPKRSVCTSMATNERTLSKSARSAKDFHAAIRCMPARC